MFLSTEEIEMDGRGADNDPDMMHLQQHVDRCNTDMKALKELMLEMFHSRDKATDVANHSLDKRLDTMNEFRDQLRTQAATFIARPEHTSLIDQFTRAQQKIQADLSSIAIRVAALEARFYLGGAGIVIVISCIQLALNYWR